MAECPVCQKQFSAEAIETHVNKCLEEGDGDDGGDNGGDGGDQGMLGPYMVNCPMCNKQFSDAEVVAHVNKCLAMDDEGEVSDGGGGNEETAPVVDIVSSDGEADNGGDEDSSGDESIVFEDDCRGQKRVLEEGVFVPNCETSSNIDSPRSATSDPRPDRAAERGC
eukprot:TRINITY_DN9280_c0_g1_i2.p2 TRINITY_DN9280_c0_g1~~TRINITY_DN9280_c0_g1_i2.p2  ORF type:complete len:166 (+),score=42.49 TRINITY_DN9280_c0_g1_i2:78-575(+)